MGGRSYRCRMLTGGITCTRPTIDNGQRCAAHLHSMPAPGALQRLLQRPFSDIYTCWRGRLIVSQGYMLVHGKLIGNPNLGKILAEVAVDSRGGDIDADDWMPEIY